MRSEAFVPLEYDVFAGLDVDKKSISVTFSDHRRFLRSLRMPSNAEHLINYVHKHFAEQKVAFAYEAGPTGYGLYDTLTAQAYRCLVVAPSMIRKAPGKRVKTNRLDSRTLSEDLRGGQLKSIRVPSRQYRDLRHLTQLRDTFVAEAKGMKLRIKSLLLFEGIDFPPAPPHSQWSSKVKKALRELQCPSTVRFKLDELLDSLEFTEKRVLKVTREIRRLCKEDEELRQSIELLMTIPGIGWIVGSQLVARIGDWREIGNVREMASFIGVVPSETSTGERTQRGPITHTGHGQLRSKLVQASWSAIQKDGELREFFRSVYCSHAREGAKQIAIVAVAHKLASRVAAVLREQRPYVIRKKVSSAPLTQEETRPRERLDPGQNQEEN